MAGKKRAVESQGEEGREERDCGEHGISRVVEAPILDFVASLLKVWPV